MAWLAILAIVLQLGAPSLHPAMAAPAEADAVGAIGALTALLGPNVALCLHEDGSAPGFPAHDQHKCCDDCMLCQHGGFAAALLPPNHAIPAPFASNAKRLFVAAWTRVGKPNDLAFAQPRGPPLSA